MLIVDDDASLRLLCRVNLELEGYHVLEAPSVAAAEDAVAADPVDLFLLDVHIGADDGLALMRSLRARKHRAPVVLFTGSARLDSVTAAVAWGEEAGAIDTTPAKTTAATAPMAAMRRDGGDQGWAVIIGSAPLRWGGGNA